MKMLLLSPYDAMSHVYFREGLTEAFPDWKVTTVSLPPRHFSWRFRGNSLTMSQMSSVKEGGYDVVLATSMTDLSALRGLCPAVTRARNVVYFHENQFAYPEGEMVDRSHLLERQITSCYTALAADTVVFNSTFNRDTLLAGVTSLLGRMPDHVPPGIVDAIEQKSCVMPVPLRPESFGPPGRSARFTLVWNHRWEYDKGPDRLREIVAEVIDRGLDMTVHLVGQQFRQIPPTMRAVAESLEDAGMLGQCGFLPRTEYLDLLSRSQVVLSTAHHEFQGLAVLEAMARGCAAIVPDALAYPEFVAPGCRYSTVEQATALIVQQYEGYLSNTMRDTPDVSHLSWQAQRSAWERMLR